MPCPAAAEEGTRPSGRLGPFLTNGQAGEQLALLNEVGGKVGTTLDLGFTAHELCQVLVPRVADFACVDLVDGLISDSELPEARPDDDTMLRRVALVYNESAGQWDHVLAEGALVAMPRRTPPGMALQLNQPVLVPVVSQDVAVDYAAALGGPGSPPWSPAARCWWCRSPPGAPCSASSSSCGCPTAPLRRGRRRHPQGAGRPRRALAGQRPAAPGRVQGRHHPAALDDPDPPAADPRRADRPPVPAGRLQGRGRRRLVRRDPAARQPGRPGGR
ncbi:hypothetical protein ACFQ0M_25240 [Kitasatospora aburaviensis]